MDREATEESPGSIVYSVDVSPTVSTDEISADILALTVKTSKESSGIRRRATRTCTSSHKSGLQEARTGKSSERV